MSITKQNVSNVPKLRFKEFSGGWKNRDVNGLITEESLYKPLDGNHGNIHPKSTDFTKEGIPFVMANNIQNGKIDLEGSHKISKELADSLQKGFSITGDILLTHKGSIGLTAIVPEIETDYIMLTPQVTYYRVKDTSKIYNIFLKYIFNSFNYQKRIITLASGGTRPYVGITEQRTIEINIPKLPEQQKIASFLSSIDEKIESIKEKKEKIEEFKKGVMQKIFSQEMRFKDENGESFDYWEEKKLGDVIEFRNGKAHEKEIDMNGEYVVVNSKFISTEGRIKKYSNLIIAPLAKGEIVMVMSDIPNGKAIAKCYIINEDNKYTLNQRICGLKMLNINTIFLYYQLNRNKYYLKFDDGISQTNLRKDDVLNCPINYPPIEEQQKIADYLSGIDEKIEKVDEELKGVEEFKKGLLQKMFV